MASYDTTEVDVTFVRGTDAAILARSADGDEVWLPRSQISFDGVEDEGVLLVVTLPEWLARDKDLI